MPPKPSQNLPQIPSKPRKDDPRSSEEATRSTFEDHSKYKHEKMNPKNNPRSPKSPQSFPKPAPNPPKWSPRCSQIRFVKPFLVLFISYCKFASILGCFFFINFVCSFKSRSSNFMRPCNVSWPSTAFRVIRQNHQKSSKNPSQIHPKPLRKPRKIDLKSKKNVQKMQNKVRGVKKNEKNCHKSATRGKKAPRQRQNLNSNGTESASSQSSQSKPKQAKENKNKQ